MTKKSGLSDSPFFQRSSPPPASTISSASQPEKANSRPTVRPDEQHVRTAVRVYDRSASDRRVTKRHPFEIYEDQLASLKTLKAQSMLDGQERSMSEMVRQALDNFLEQQS